MADLDTQEKRRAAVAVGSYAFGPDVTPLAAPDQEWRQEAGYGYPGILAAAPVAAAAHRMGWGGFHVRQF